jgi:ATP-dependent DNA helicase RecQ
MIALTATATPLVLDEIEKRLRLREPVRVRTGFDRPNLAFEVRALRTEKERIDVVLAELDRAGVRGRGGRGGSARGRALVYCSTRKVTERVAKALRGAGLRVGHYHAGRTKLARERAQDAFEMGRTRVLVATNAFGMGIDLPDIRLIVHFQTPGSVEAYYQEAGRAGRDGEPARCVLFFGRGDLATQRRLSEKSGTSAAMDQRRDDSLAAIERYATETDCRHRVLVSHFTGSGEEPECGRCDVCLGEVSGDGLGSGLESDEAGRWDGDDARAGARGGPPLASLSDSEKGAIVAAVDRLRRPVGRRKLAQALRGGKAKSLARGGLLTLPEYGTLSGHVEDAIVGAIDELLREGRLQKTGRKYPTVWIPGKAVRGRSGDSEEEGEAGGSGSRARAVSRYGGDIARALDNYRKRTARKLGWKTYMVFQRNVMIAIERVKPESLEALARVPGMGPAKVERFGQDVLALVREHRGRGAE